jgi:lysozyme
MAIIPRSQRPAAPNAVALPYVDTGADRIGRAVAGFGNAVSSLGETVAREQSKEIGEQEDFEYKLGVSEFLNNEQLGLDDHLYNYKGDGKDLTQSWDQGYQQRAQEFLKTVPQARQTHAALTLSHARGGFQSKAQNASQGFLTQSNLARTDGELGRLAATVGGNFDQIGPALARADAVISAIPGITETQRQAKREEAAALMVRQWATDATPEEKEARLGQIESQAKAWSEQQGLAKTGQDVRSPAGAPAVKTSERGLKFIRDQEGFYETAYFDVKGYSVGYGSFGAKKGEKITREEAEVRMRSEVAKIEGELAEKIKAPLSQGQHDSLVSMFYNLGTGKGRLDRVAEMVNSGRADDVPDYMAQFTRAGGKKLAGLERRRNDEINLFRSGGDKVADASGGTARSVDTMQDAMLRTLLKVRPQLVEEVTKEREKRSAQAWFQGVASGQVAVNPADGESKKEIDKQSLAARLGETLYKGAPEQVNAAVSIVQQMQYAPRDVFEAFKGMAQGENAERKALAYEAVISVVETTPHAFDGHAGSEKLIEEAQVYSSLRQVGDDPKKALARMAELQSPEHRKLASARDKEADVFIAKEITDKELTHQLSRGGLGDFLNRPDVGGDADPNSTLRIMGEFKERAREHFVKWGDKDLAQTLAARDLMKTYGVSDLFDRKQIMKYPPERLFPPVGKDGHKWIGDQLKEDIKDRLGLDVGDDQVSLRGDHRTAKEIALGQTPSYLVVIKREKGLAPEILRWAPDATRAQGGAKAKFDTEREKAKKSPTFESGETPGQQAPILEPGDPRFKAPPNTFDSFGG